MIKENICNHCNGTGKVVGPETYDSKFGDDRICKCGHPYYRHFDTYEDMYPCGCKYCDCRTFE
jgi:hypothetical protein